MSAGGTCCCVCSIFDYPSPYRTFDPEKLQQLYQQMSPVKRHRVRKPLSLTVVVQRALIELPKSLLHKCSVADEGGNDRGMPPEESDGEGEEFLTCQSCSICVHRSCYGVSQDVPLSNWLCTRCEQNAINAECCLCMLRGGALKPTDTARWAHLVCAVSIPEVIIGDPRRKEPVEMEALPRSRRKLRCTLCQSLSSGTTRGHGVCVQCARPRCYTAMHVTCAQYQGLTPEITDTYSGLICHKHGADMVGVH